MEISQGLNLIADKTSLRLDKYISESCQEFSRSYVQTLIEEGFVTVNSFRAKCSQKIKIGDIIQISPPPVSTPTSLVPQNIPLSIVFEDRDLLVINKPAGISVHPAPGHPDNTLVNAVIAHCPEIISIDDTVRPGIVHRLDKDTSGLMVIAKNRTAFSNLSQQIKNRQVLKKYLALAKGRPPAEEGMIQSPIARHPVHRQRMAVVPGGRDACTHYKILSYFRGYTLLEARLVTGRTHQIRVHLSSIGCPIAGDSVYGVSLPPLQRQFLHAYLLGFKIPATGEFKEFRSDLPADLSSTLENLSQADKGLPAVLPE